VSIPGWLLPGSPRDLRPYLVAYDGEISAADAAFDTLLREVRSMRGERDTIVVLTADHGEEFLDHGGWEHGTNLHDELIRVPLVIQAPSSPPGVIDTQVQLIDLFPTLLGMAGVPLHATSGRALEVLLDRRSSSHPAMSEIVGAQSALREEKFKLITLATGQAQLFDLARDPHETIDVAAANPARVNAMRTVLDRMRADAIEAGRGIHTEMVPIDPDVARRLRTLGVHPALGSRWLGVKCQRGRKGRPTAGSIPMTGTSGIRFADLAGVKGAEIRIRPIRQRGESDRACA
jgi:Arylsulfatase A and related enzymes